MRVPSPFVGHAVVQTLLIGFAVSSVVIHIPEDTRNGCFGPLEIFMVLGQNTIKDAVGPGEGNECLVVFLQLYQ